MEIIKEYTAEYNIFGDTEKIIVARYPNGKFYIHYGWMEKHQRGSIISSGYENIEEAEKALKKHFFKVIEIIHNGGGIMKKEIENLINSENGKIDINKCCVLYRWTENALGDPVDCLHVEFNIIGKPDYVFPIKSREWRKIVEEIAEAQTIAFQKMAEKLNKELENGYIKGGKSDEICRV